MRLPVRDNDSIFFSFFIPFFPFVIIIFFLPWVILTSDVEEVGGEGLRMLVGDSSEVTGFYY